LATSFKISQFSGGQLEHFFKHLSRAFSGFFKRSNQSPLKRHVNSDDFGYMCYSNRQGVPAEAYQQEVFMNDVVVNRN
jgi:hypothetical protein